MDVLKLIKSQISQIKESDNSVFLDAIKVHLERAEYYYNSGKKDSNFFNDVIYRTNQAYEGALKEAYKVLAGKTQDDVLKSTPYKIESYLEQNNIFKERVLELFKNYRQEWRNKSTHDYKLFFDDSEAFIAYNSVTAFVHLLLKQLIERIAYAEESERLKSRSDLIDELLKSLDEEDLLIDKVSNLLISFLNDKDSKFKDLKEYEILGKLTAFFETSKEKLNVQQEPLLNKSLRPDFIVEGYGETLIIEVKKRLSTSMIDSGINQLITYLSYSQTNQGILLLIEPDQRKKYKVKNMEIKQDEKKYLIKVIKK